MEALITLQKGNSHSWTPRYLDYLLLSITRKQFELHHMDLQFSKDCFKRCITFRVMQIAYKAKNVWFYCCHCCICSNCKNRAEVQPVPSKKLFSMYIYDTSKYIQYNYMQTTASALLQAMNWLMQDIIRCICSSLACLLGVCPHTSMLLCLHCSMAANSNSSKQKIKLVFGKLIV